MDRSITCGPLCSLPPQSPTSFTTAATAHTDMEGKVLGVCVCVGGGGQFRTPPPSIYALFFWVFWGFFGGRGNFFFFTGAAWLLAFLSTTTLYPPPSTPPKEKSCHHLRLCGEGRPLDHHHHNSGQIIQVRGSLVAHRYCVTISTCLP